MQGKITVYADHVRNKISRHIFGHFMEHSGKVIYESVYDPTSELADEDGFRTDVLEALREVKTPMLRYPGGNFVSNFFWEDSVGPVDQRPARLDLAWKTLEKNQVGLHEFNKWAKAANSEVMMAINLGTRGIADALNLLE